MNSNRNGEIKLVPSGIGEFEWMWGGLRSVEKLWIPFCEQGEEGAELSLGSSETSSELSSLATEKGGEMLDAVSWTDPSGEHVGIVYTARELGELETVHLEVGTREALERFLNSPKNVGALIFNPPRVGEDWFSCRATRVLVARLVGMLECEDPWVADVGRQCLLAKDALRRDRPYEALFRASLARERGAKLDDFFFTEVMALRVLGFSALAFEYFPFYGRQGGTSEEYRVLEARLRLASGQTQQSIEILSELRAQAHPLAEVELEWGRAMLFSGRVEEAIASFQRCAEEDREDRENWDAWLGLGIALRKLHWESREREGLKEAYEIFARVVEMNGYHAAEALHHQGTIELACDRYEQAEVLFRRTLALRWSGVSKRNLILVLHACGRQEEALREYELLMELEPAQAYGLDGYVNGRAPSADAEDLSESVVVPRTQLGAEREPEFVALYEEAKREIQRWRLGIKGDLGDFARIDEFVNYHAPLGEFLENTIFYGLSSAELSGVLVTVARYLAGVLVLNGQAKWCEELADEPKGVVVEMRAQAAAPVVMDLWQTVVKRISVGALADNVFSLSILVRPIIGETVVTGEARATEEEVSPYRLREATAAELREYKRMATFAQGVLTAAGYELTGQLSDLSTIDSAIDALYQYGGELRTNSPAHHLAAGQEKLLMYGLGLHLGFLIQEMTEGKWFVHPHVSGCCLQETLLLPFYPVNRVWQRIRTATVPNALTILEGLEPPLICANLARKLQHHEVQTREELMRLLAATMPTLLGVEQSSGALERMADLIYGQASMET